MLLVFSKTVTHNFHQVHTHSVWYFLVWECTNNLGRNDRGFSFLSVMRAAEREESCNCASTYSSCFVLQAMASEMPLCYIQQSMGCEMMMYSLVLSVVLGQHWRALDFSICECQSATSLMLGFIFSFSSWVNLEFLEMLRTLNAQKAEVQQMQPCASPLKSTFLDIITQLLNVSAHNLFLRNILLSKIMSRLLQSAEHVSVSRSWGYWITVLLNGAWRCRAVVEKGLISWVC